ncbi:hypothetical protein CC86DRAFT_430192 [Ophiobolus disseminans]|uniref:Uncharacterized protein n=1 Tax=Ophiobolus disseminans TaxID=1469910 RepID=A0A6A6ZFG7_9PLEO|nr:hypothetical protein CC86DRAFT_430192 [Ophiobolus disseminans]
MPATSPRSYSGDVSLLSRLQRLIYHSSQSRASTTRLPQRQQRHLAHTPTTSPLSHGGDISSLLRPRRLLYLMPTIALTPATSPPSLTSITRLYYTPASTPATSPRSHTRDVFSISRRRCHLALTPATAPALTPATSPRSHARDVSSISRRQRLLALIPAPASTTRLPPLHACLYARDITSLSRPRHLLALIPVTASTPTPTRRSRRLLHLTAATSPRSYARDCHQCLHLPRRLQRLLYHSPESRASTTRLPPLHACLDVFLLLRPRRLIHHSSQSRASTTRLPSLYACLHYTPTSTTRLSLLHACLYARDNTSLSRPRLPRRRRRHLALMPATASTIRLP